MNSLLKVNNKGVLCLFPENNLTHLVWERSVDVCRKIEFICKHMNNEERQEQINEFLKLHK